MVSRRHRYGLMALASWLAATASALAQALPVRSARSSTLGWIVPLFQPHYLTAFDYIMLLIALVLGAAVGVFYYRGVLLDAVKRMQKPSKVKLRAAGLGLLVASLVLLVAPNLPSGWLVVIALMAAILASSFGMSLLLAAILVLGAVALATAKYMHWFL